MQRLTRLIAALFTLAAIVGIWWSTRPDSLSLDDRFEQARGALARGESEGLEETLALLDGDPAYQSHVKILLAESLLSAQQPERALELLAGIEARSDLREIVLIDTARGLHAVGRSLDAESLLRSLIADDPERPDAYRWLAVVYYDLGAFDQALGALERVIKLVPDDHRPHQLAGMMHLDFERYGEAVPFFRDALERNPPAAAADELTRLLATALIALRDYDAAAAVLGTRGGESTDRKILLAQCEWNRGNADSARRLLAETQGHASELPAALRLDAEIHEAEGDAEGAIELLRQLLQSDPHDAASRLRLSQLLRKTGRTGEADEELARWQSTNDLIVRLSELNSEAVQKPRDAGIRDELAEVCDQLDKSELAAMWRKAAAACRIPGQSP